MVAAATKTVLDEKLICSESRSKMRITLINAINTHRICNPTQTGNILQAELAIQTKNPLTLW